MKVGNLAQLWSAQAMASGALTSKSLDVSYSDHAYVHATVTGASGLSGTLKLQYRLRDPGNAASATNWVDIPNSSQAVAGNGDYVWDITQPGGDDLQIVYAGTGTGTIDAKARKKVPA